ncbi:MAG TPA: hypothetical protein VF380_07920 [Solirubrobacteraceae bacterium]
MLQRVRMPSHAARLTVVAALVCALVGCGKSQSTTSASAAAAGPPKSCPATVLDTLGHVARLIYLEGVSSERTVVAQRAIAGSAALRQAVERGDAAATTAAARALVAQGHMTNLLITTSAGRTLADVGGAAIAPLRGTLKGAGGVAIASYVTSVWSDVGYVTEASGVTQGKIALRVKHRNVAGSLAVPPGPLSSDGTVTVAGVRYQYSSFGGHAFPSGALRVYLLRPVSSTESLCGSTSEETTVNTLSRVAQLIYEGEAGGRTLPQVRRVQRNAALLGAVAQRDPAATKAAVEKLLNEHIVRLRVLDAQGNLLSDVGGPYVLAPVGAPLQLGGRTIGSFVLSIQDDEGYLRLARRLAGLRVLMYMGAPGHTQLVKNSLGPEPGSVPDSGSYQYRGSSFRVYTLHGSAFPSGPLTIHVLIPIPYP